MNYIYTKLIVAITLCVLSCVAVYCSYHIFMYYSEKEQKENDKGEYKI